MLGDEVPDARIDLAAKPAAAEDAVVSDPVLQVVATAGARNTATQLVSGNCLAGRAEIIVRGFDGE